MSFADRFKPVRTITVDLESRSEINLLDVGVYNYAAHSTTEIVQFAYKWKDGDGPWGPKHFVQLIKGLDGIEAIYAALARMLNEVGESLQLGSVEHFAGIVADPRVLVSAHNFNFEKVMFKNKLPEIIIQDQQWTCTAARARRVGLPGALGNLARALDLDIQKDNVGNLLMKQACKPQSRFLREGKGFKWKQDAETLARILKYCGSDIDAQADLTDRLPAMPDYDYERWWCTNRMNERGMLLDRPLIEAAQTIVNAHEQSVLTTVRDATDGKVMSLGQYDAMNAVLLEHGLKMPRKQGKNGITADWTADTVEAFRVGNELSACPPVEAIIWGRQELGKSGSKKLFKMASSICADGRSRDTTIWFGANTGRPTGSSFQPLNMVKAKIEGDQYQLDVNAVVKTGDIGKVREFVEKLNAEGEKTSILDTVGAALRGIIIPPKGKVFMGSDYTAIEGMLSAWISGQDDMLEDYRQGVDLYCRLAESIFNKSGVNKKDHPFERKVGKVGILGCQYGLGSKGFQAMCIMQFGVDPDDMPDELAQKTVRAYREKYSQISGGWYECEKAFITAYRNPGKIYHACMCDFRSKSNWVMIDLPSGNTLYFPYVSLSINDGSRMAWAKGKLDIKYKRMKMGRYVHDYIRGPSIFESICQSLGRSILTDAELALEKIPGIDTVLTVYDEFLTEVPNNLDMYPLLAHTMKYSSPWAEGLPLSVDGWRGMMFGKWDNENNDPYAMEVGDRV